MSSRFTELVIDANDPQVLAVWWGAILECEVHSDEGDAWLEPRDSVRELAFVPVPEGKTIKNRLHIDLSPYGCDQATELERLKSLGAVEIDIGQGDQTWHVLADPEGNEFCLLRGRADEKPS